MKKKKMRRKHLLVFVMVSILLCGQAKNLTAADKELDTWVAKEYQDYCILAGEEYAIVPELLVAMMEKESSGRAEVSNGNCKGLMQINEPYHLDRMERLGVRDIYDPYGNIRVAADYLHELFVEYEDIGTVLMVYNGSSDALERGMRGDYTQYAADIIKRSAQLERMNGK